MENASKALIMAASVLIAIVIISAFVLMMSNLTSYQQRNYDVTLTAQVAEFNNEFATYARDGIRGSDMISLMNKIVDYNARYTDTEGYTKMHVTIDMNGINEKLLYDDDLGNRLITEQNYNEDTIVNIVGQPNLTTVIGSNDSSAISNNSAIRQLETKYEQKYCNQLAAEIFNIDSIANNSSYTSNKKVEEFDKERILPKTATDYYTTNSVNKIYEDALLYYEYIQFKRTYFDCSANPEYDRNTGRIIKLEFKCTGVGE